MCVAGFSMDSIIQILQGLAKSYFNVKGGSSPAIQVSYFLGNIHVNMLVFI
jgi:hypothetical protein